MRINGAFGLNEMGKRPRRRNSTNSPPRYVPEILGWYFLPGVVTIGLRDRQLNLVSRCFYDNHQQDAKLCNEAWSSRTDHRYLLIHEPNTLALCICVCPLLFMQQLVQVQVIRAKAPSIVSCGNANYAGSACGPDADPGRLFHGG